MRGSFSFDDLMFKISHEDRQILNKIIQDNVENTNKTNLPLV
jgi:hypothetical protein